MADQMKRKKDNMKGKDMKVKRLVTALLGFPIVILFLVFVKNVIIVDIAFSVVAILAIKEFFNSFSKIGKPIKWMRIFSCCIYSVYTYNTYEIRDYYYGDGNTNFCNYYVCSSNCK